MPDLVSIIAFAALFLALSSPLLAQQQPAAEQPTEQAIATSVAMLPTMTPAQEGALAAANAEIARRLEARSSPLAAGSNVQAVALNPTPSGRYDLVFRYRVGWIEWSETQLLTRTEQELPANAVQAAAAVNLTLLEVRVLAREEADRIVKSCNALLSPTVNVLSPPFYRRPTNVRWDAQAGAPILRSFARIPNTENQCVRADLNLVTGAAMCRDVACATH